MILMLHYVNDLQLTRAGNYVPKYFCDRGFLSDLISRFKHSGKTFVSFRDYVDLLNQGRNLADFVCVTFDDATADFYSFAMPILIDWNVPATVFPIASRVDADPVQVLPVHCYQVATAASANETEFCHSIDMIIKSKLTSHEIEDFAKRIEDWAGLDSKNVLLNKRILEFLFGEDEARAIISEAFCRVSETECFDRYESYLQNFYCTPEQLLSCKSAGIEIGSHGHNHIWLGEVALDRAIDDVLASVETLRSFDLVEEDLGLCYPHGSWNERLVKTLHDEFSDLIYGAVTINDSTITKNKHLTISRVDIADISKN